MTLAEEGDTARAVLRHRWDLDPDGDEDWTYEVPADLTLVEDVWQVRWSTALVARGATVVPRLLADAPQPEPEAEPLTAPEAEALRELLRAVVTEGGATFLADVPGEPVLAKTGTAQFGVGEGLANHAWMIGIQGDLAVAVFVEDGDDGSTTAGPLLEEFLRLVGGAR